MSTFRFKHCYLKVWDCALWNYQCSPTMLTNERFFYATSGIEDSGIIVGRTGKVVAIHCEFVNSTKQVEEEEEKPNQKETKPTIESLAAKVKRLESEIQVLQKVKSLKVYLLV